ncbi:hypothetical protein MYXA107069_35805 [Myxococcus xanthus]
MNWAMRIVWSQTLAPVPVVSKTSSRVSFALLSETNCWFSWPWAFWSLLVTVYWSELGLKCTSTSSPLLSLMKLALSGVVSGMAR